MDLMIQKFIKAFSSVKLAVVIIIALATLIAVGTIVESRYNAQVAAKLVYHTWMMYVVMGALALTLIAVMVDRWPWKKRHIPFLLAHVGILILQLGSVVTAKYGLDGNMRFGMGETNRFVTVPNTELQVWSSFDGDRYTKLLEKEVDFFVDPPSKNPLQLELPEGTFKVDDYAPFVIPSRKIIASQSPRTGAGLRFQVQNDRANINEWLFQKKAGAMDTRKFGL
ncbi:MAG: cytochrome c biogenesis protein ResB, partial [Pseudobdellovibrionaceae bacterium]